MADDENIVMENDPLGLGMPVVGASPRAVGGEENGHRTDPSIVDMLKQELSEIEQIETAFIRIPGYDKISLQAQYRLPEKGSEIDNINRSIEREFKGESAYVRNLFLSISIMIALNEGLYVQPIGQPEPVELDPEMRGSPVTYVDCHAAFGFDPSMKTREVVRRIFGGSRHDMALLMHAEKLNRWMANTKADLTLEFWQTSGE
ncbi:MAG TPA: hypothetical protein VGE97_00825 [Nitrososphaera sp.]